MRSKPPYTPLKSLISIKSALIPLKDAGQVLRNPWTFILQFLIYQKCRPIRHKISPQRALLRRL